MAQSTLRLSKYLYDQNLQKKKINLEDLKWTEKQNGGYYKPRVCALVEFDGNEEDGKSFE